MKFLKGIDTNYFITFLFLLLSSNANFLVASNVAWFLILLFILSLAIGKKLISQDGYKKIGIFSAIYIIFVCVRDIAVNNLEYDYLISDVVFLFKYVYLAFLFCIILKDKIMVNIIKVMKDLTIISFFFYAFQLVGLGDYIYKYSKSLNLPVPLYLPGYTNFVIFTLTKGRHDLSNSGFVWEPGAFGCFLMIALLMNLFVKKFKIDAVSVLFIIAIITNYSTTVYLGLLIVLFMVYRIRVPKINFQAVLIIVVFILLIVFIPVLGSKITDTYYSDMDDLNRLKILQHFYHQQKMQIPLNRFASMVYIYNAFGASLILGICNQYDLILNRAFDINISNGIFEFIAKFGLVGYVFFMYKYGRYCMSYVKNNESLIYCMLIMFVLGFAEPVLYLPLFLVFLFIPLAPKALGQNSMNPELDINPNPLLREKYNRF